MVRSTYSRTIKYFTLLLPVRRTHGMAAGRSLGLLTSDKVHLRYMYRIIVMTVAQSILFNNDGDDKRLDVGGRPFTTCLCRASREKATPSSASQ